MSAQKQYDELVHFYISSIRQQTAEKGIAHHFSHHFSPSQPDFRRQCEFFLDLLVGSQKALKSFVEASTTGLVPYSRPTIEQCLSQMMTFEDQLREAAIDYVNYDWFISKVQLCSQLNEDAFKLANRHNRMFASMCNPPSPRHHVRDNPPAAQPYDLDAAVADRPS